MPRRKDPIHGFIYQLKLLMLFLHRGIRCGYDFILRTEMEEAGCFDDLIFEYKQANQIFFRLLQAKHSLDERKKINTADLLAGMAKDQKYSLVKYYYSYMKCKNQNLFKSGSFEDLIICTNIDFDFTDLDNNGIVVYPVTEEDNILNINISGGQKNPMRYTFDENFADLLLPELEENYDSSVVKDLVKFILTNKPLHKKHFGAYVNALTYEVIDKKNKNLSKNFVYNKNLSDRAAEFRKMFECELNDKSDKKLDLVSLYEAIYNGIPYNCVEIKLIIPNAFGQNRPEIQWPREKERELSIAKDLVGFILGNKELHESHFGTYVNILNYDVIDREAKQLFPNFVSNKKLCSRASEFRDMFEREVKSQSKNKLSLDTLNEAINNGTPFNGEIIRLNISEGFKQHRKENIWPSKDIDREDVLEFLNLLIFAVKQINEVELGEAIKFEIGDHFNTITTESIYKNLFQHMVDFLQDKKHTGNAEFKFWTFEEGKKFINDTCFQIIYLQLSSYRDHLDSINFYFKETLFEKPQDFINSEEPLWLVTSETPWLSTLVIYQSLKNNVHSFNVFIYKWNDLLDNRGKILLYFKNLDQFLIIITCLQVLGTEDITEKFVEKIEELFFSQYRNSKKIIVVASKNHKLQRKLLSKHPNCHSRKINIGFCDLEDTSQKLLMESEKIYFEGTHQLSLQKLLNIKGEEVNQKSQVLNFDIAATELLLRDSEIKVFQNTNGFSSIIYSPNEPVSFNSVINEMTSNNFDIFAFYGDDEDIQTSFQDKQIELVRFSDTDSFQLLIKHRYILLDLEREAIEFNLLCKRLYDSTCLISEKYKPALHKLKYVDKDKWIWMKTFDWKFYINRRYRQIVVSKRILKLLAEENSQDFILFSGEQENKVLSKICEYYSSQNIAFNSYTFANNCDTAKLKKTSKRKFNFLSKTFEENAPYDPNDSYFTATRFHNKKAIHVVEFQNVFDYNNQQNLQLRWQKSVGNILAVRKRFNYGDDFLSEDNLINFNQRVILIADGPGEGKSSSLTRIVQRLKKYKPTSLIIEIDLNKLQNCSVSFCVQSKAQLIGFLFQVLKKSSAHAIETKILEYKMDHSEQLFVLFDGFDEVSREQKENILKLFTFIIQKTKITLWITARLEDRKKLENSLCALSYPFNPLSRTDKVNYMSHFWRTGLKFLPGQNFDFEKCAKTVCLHFISISGDFDPSIFIKVPLMLRSVAATYLNVFRDIILNETENDLDAENILRKVTYTDTFETFVRKVYDTYFFEKLKLADWFDKESQEILKDTYSKAYRCLAVKEVCGYFFNPLHLLLHIKEKISLITLSRIGLIQILRIGIRYSSAEIDSSNSLTCRNDMYNFIHPSLSDYFATEFICIELKSNPESEIFWEFLIEKILIRQCSRIAFNDKLGMDHELSCLSSPILQRRIVFNLLNAQVEKYGSAKTLWKAIESKFRQTVVFLIKWYVDVDEFSHYLFNFVNSSVARRILNMDILLRFSNENDLVDYLMNRRTQISIKSFSDRNVVISSLVT